MLNTGMPTNSINSCPVLTCIRGSNCMHRISVISVLLEGLQYMMFYLKNQHPDAVDAITN